MSAGRGRCSVHNWQFPGAMRSKERWSIIDEWGSITLSGGPLPPDDAGTGMESSGPFTWTVRHTP